MSDFKELIKSFAKTREYVRDFFVYGFKTRDEFSYKSPRTYDNERRRLESWLAPYVRKDHVSNGANISLSIDSNLLDTNPLFQVWKTKSFTDNDIVLHFLVLDLLMDGSPRTADEITSLLLTQYEALFDTQTVRRKCNAYAKEGLLSKESVGRKVFFSLDSSLVIWMKSHETMLDALAFYQMAGNFGIIGNMLSEQLDSHNQTFRVKHSFFVHTLEEEILLCLLDAMKHKANVQLEIKSSKKGTPNPYPHAAYASEDAQMDSANATGCTPLQIFTSTRSGRRFLCAYVSRSKRFTCFRLDTIKKVIPTQKPDNYDKLQDKLKRNRKYLWGVSFQGRQGHRLDRLTMSIYALEPTEQYIVERLKREGRGGTVTRIERNTYQYEIEVFDCNEMLPWIRTFTGRILSLECTDASVKQRFYQDLQELYQIYHIDGTI